MNHKRISLPFLQKCLSIVTSMWIYFGLFMLSVVVVLRLLMAWKLVQPDLLFIYTAAAAACMCSLSGLLTTLMVSILVHGKFVDRDME